MENEIVKILTDDYQLAERELAAKVASSIGNLFQEKNNSKYIAYLEKSLIWMQSFVQTMDRDSVDRVQLDHLISEIEEFLRTN